MPNEPVTIDTILDYLQNAVENKTPIPPAVWIDAASKLNVLLGDESDRLYGLQQKVAQMKLSYLLNDKKKNVKMKYKKISEKKKRKIRLGNSKDLKGRTIPLEVREKIRKTLLEKRFNWKGGRPKCLDCGIIVWYASKRCNPCSNKLKNS